MTNRERLISLLGFKLSDQNAIDGALIDANIDGTQTYTNLVGRQIKTVAISLLDILLSTADFTNADQTSVKYDRAAIEARIKLIKGELGLIDQSFPTINTKRVW